MKKAEKQAESIIGKYRNIRREDLIPILQEIQDETGYLSKEVLVKVAKATGLSVTKIYGLATFYDQFRFFPQGKCNIILCNGTSCYMNGAGSMAAKIKEELGIEPGEITRDGNFSYEHSHCVGGCSCGPVLIVNGEYRLNVKPDQISSLISSLKKQQQVL